MDTPKDGDAIHTMRCVTCGTHARTAIRTKAARGLAGCSYSRKSTDTVHSTIVFVQRAIVSIARVAIWGWPDEGTPHLST